MALLKAERKDILSIYSQVWKKISIRIKDDCIMFDSLKRLGTSDEIESNIGVRFVKNMASSMYYQTTFGLNVLNIEI